MKAFVKTSNVMRVINLANRYRKLPSEILNIEDEYISFCFDEACLYITSQIEKDKKPKWVDLELTEDEKRNKAYMLAQQLKKGGGAE